MPPRLITQVTPAYPEGASGSAEVTVVVTVGTDGAVTAVEPLDGPPAFTAAAVEAAWRLAFEPATRGDAPVAVRLPATFRFSPQPASPPVDDAAFEMVVEAERPERSDTHARVVLDETALQRTKGQDFAEVVAQVPGVATARGSADGTKPIIRGQHERRLLVLSDGVRHASQKWGSDHSTEIDPFSAGQISVIKGAAGVRYGPDAIGGVVLVEPRPLRFQPGVDGTAHLVGVSNGQRGIGALRLDLAPAGTPGLALRLEGNYARGAALSAPDYVLGNTGSQTWNLGATARYHRDLATWTLSYHHYDLLAGIAYAASHHTVDDLLAALDAEIPVGAQNWTTTYAIDRPYQAVTHDVVLARSELGLGTGTLRTTYAFQSNARKEYEQVRDAVTGPQYDFTLRTHSLDVDWTQDAIGLGASPWSVTGGVGASGSFQENVYAGLPLIPNHRSWSGGVFGYQRLSTDRGAIEAGARYDHQSRSSFLTDSAFARHLSRGTLEEDDCEATDSAVRCDLSFDTGSVSLGGLWHAVEDHLDLKLDLSSASRFPNGDELYMNGSAPTSPVYALGDPSLGVETTWGISPTVGARLPWMEAEASVYANLIDNYVYFAPEIGESGVPAYDVTIRGVYPRFTFRPVDALFYGVDGGIAVGADGPVELALQGAIVRGRERASGDWLLFVPPDRVRMAATGRPPVIGPLSDSFVEFSAEYVAEQTRVEPGADLAPPPGDYVLVGAAVGTQVPLGAERTLKIGLEGSNLLNARYREYTSLLRYYADEPGRELRLRLVFDF